MRPSVSSIHTKVLSAFLAVIFLTIALGTFIEYRIYASELPGLITGIQTRTIAMSLSLSYTRNNGWDQISSEIMRYSIPGYIKNSNKNSDDPGIRVIVRDSEGKTVYNSFTDILSVGETELVEGLSQPVIDYGRSEQVGIVTLYISSEYLDRQAAVYARGLIRSGIYKVFFTALIALLLSLLLSKRITEPVVRLTEAAKSVAESGSAEPIRTGSGDEIGQLGNAFNSMITALQSQRGLRKQLIADVSHEINTPLNSIRLEARALSDGLVSPDEAALRIIANVDSLKNTVYDLDWLSESDSGSYRLEKAPCSPAVLTADEIERWKHAASAAGIKLNAEKIDSSIPLIAADPVRISTVIGNLIENAVKYAPRGSTVDIACKSSPDGIKISVCDDGPVIEPLHRERIFTRNYRAAPGSGDVPGRGLGLSIARTIIEMHGGIIRLDCGEDHGNCFSFSLPV